MNVIKDQFFDVRHEILLGLILILALAFRWLGPFLQQSTGDSPHYLALAMKLRTSGMNGYHLRGVDIETESLNRTSVQHVFRIKPTSRPDSEGQLMRDLRKQGLSYYDEPFHHIAYGYPLLLMSIHALSGKDASKGWELVHRSIEPWDLIRLHPLILASIQWYWIAPALLSSLATIILTYLLGAHWFDQKNGLWGAFLMATHPVDILTSQRIWADNVLVFLCLIALFCWFHAKDRSSWLWACLSGIALGSAILIKQSALFWGAAVGIAEIVSLGVWKKQPQQSSIKIQPKNSSWLKANAVFTASKLLGTRVLARPSFPQNPFTQWVSRFCGGVNPEEPAVSALRVNSAVGNCRIQVQWIIAAAFGTLLVVTHWFSWVWGVYGTPFYNPHLLPTDEPNPWHQLLMHRPSPIILYTLGLICLSPCMFLGWLRIREPKIQWLLSVGVVFLVFFLFFDPKEYRYLLPVFPLMAIAAARVLTKIPPRWKSGLVVLVVAQIIWSLFLTDRYAWRNWGEIMIPF